MGNKAKRKLRAKAKRKFARVERNRGQGDALQPNKKYRGAQDLEMMHITPQTLKLFTSLPPFEATFSAVPAVKEHLVAKGVQDLLAGTAMLFVQYGHWYTSGSDTILVSELVNVSNMMMANPKFLHQFGDPLGAPANG